MTENEKRAPVAGTTKSPNEYINSLYFITWLMVIATLISGWNIKDVWSGVVTVICGVVTMALTRELIGGKRNDRKSAD